MPKRFDKRDSRVLAAATVRPPLVVRFRLERNAEPLDSRWIARLVKTNARDANARIIASRDEPWKQVQLTITAANRSRIQDALGLQRIAWFRLHDLAQAMQLKVTHRRSSRESRQAWMDKTSAIPAS